MAWYNSKVMEFIELLQNEPTIWDPRKKTHKNRIAVNDAWERIKNSFSLQCSIDELKKKRNSLMAIYREHIRKIRDDDEYHPIWFAFDAMHSFLGPLYGHSDTRNTEEQTTSNSEIRLSRESDMGSGNESPQYERCNKRKNSMSTKDLLQVKEQMDEEHFVDFSVLQEGNLQNQIDESDLFGQLVALKLKKMNADDRLMLTHDINNLIFKYELKARSRLNESSSSRTSTLNI